MDKRRGVKNASYKRMGAGVGGEMSGQGEGMSQRWRWAVICCCFCLLWIGVIFGLVAFGISLDNKSEIKNLSMCVELEPVKVTAEDGKITNLYVHRKTDTLEIGSGEANGDSRGKGDFSRFLDDFEELAKETKRIAYVECVLNPILEKELMKRNYTKTIDGENTYFMATPSREEEEEEGGG